MKGQLIDLTLELDDLRERMPVIDPAPAIEFWLQSGIESHQGIVCSQAQGEPFLLLADAGTTSS